MKYKIFSVYDCKANAYLQCMFFRNSNEAVRSFSQACNQEDHEFFKHAEDYTLCEIAEFDDEMGSIQSLPAPVTLIRANDASHKHREWYAARSLNQVA